MAAMTENHKKMWDLFDEARCSKKIEDCESVLEKMENIVEEEPELKYYVDAVEKICSTMDHIEEEDPGRYGGKIEEDDEDEDDEDEDDEDKKFDFKKVMAALKNEKKSEESEDKIVSFPSSIHAKSNDHDMPTGVLFKFMDLVKNTLGADDESKFLLTESDGRYYIGNYSPGNKNKLSGASSFNPIFFDKNGKMLKVKKVTTLDKDEVSVKKFNNLKSLRKALFGDRKKESTPPISKNASFNEVMFKLIG